MKKFLQTEQERLKSLFTNEYSFHIPKFQREYSWEDEHVEKFWDDTNCSELQEELKKNHHDRISPYDLAKQMLER